jgi:hypothetical protein
MSEDSQGWVCAGCGQLNSEFSPECGRCEREHATGLKRVNSLNELCALALSGKCVVTPKLYCYSKRIPAAFIQNMQGGMINHMLNSGMYVYESKKAKKVICQ